MPRQRRIWVERNCYHITHRCHKRSYLFRFSKYRDIYFHYLREMKQRYRIDILNYIVTSNHVHLLVWARKSRDISSAIQYLHSRTAQDYNNLKNREGAFWTDRYHSTLIQSGYHLSCCLFYIDLNMIRAGVVSHPSEWKHSGYHEIIGSKKRYRVINIKRLLNCLEIPDYNKFHEWYTETLEKELEVNYHTRNSIWTEAAAVGSEDFLETVSKKFPSRKKRVLFNSIKNEPKDSSVKISEQKIAYLTYSH